MRRCGRRSPTTSRLSRNRWAGSTSSSACSKSVPGLRSFAKEAKEHFDFAVVCGMGGSSLAPDILADTFGRCDGYPQLYVLDSTCPQQIKELERKSMSARRSSSSPARAARRPNPMPSTRYFHEKVRSRSERRRPVATSPRSPIPERRSTKKRRRHRSARIFKNDPNIGGRYSALSFVGIAPVGDRRLRHQPIARSRAEARCTPTDGRSTPEARPACASARRSAASRKSAATS